MSKQTFPFIVIFFVFLLCGCSNAEKEAAEKQLATAQSTGDLALQESSIKVLLKEDKENQAKWQQMLLEIKQASQFNQQAQQLLEQQPFEALDLAGKADQLIYNQISRKMIVDIIKPYKDFQAIYRPLREWAYPAFDKMVAPDSLADAMKHWREAADRPNLWPNNALIALLTSKNSDPVNTFYALGEERKAFQELLVLISRMAKTTNDDKTQALFQDAMVVNNMYNAVISDLHWFYIKQAFLKLIDSNRQWLEKAQTAIKQNQANNLWLKDYQAATQDLQQTMAKCCLNAQQSLIEAFDFVEQPAAFDEQVQKLGNELTNTIDNNFSNADTPAQFVEFAKAQNTQLQQTILSVDKLAQQVNRNELATQFLYITYTWQNNTFYELERLVPYLKHYKTSIRGY